MKRLFRPQKDLSTTISSRSSTTKIKDPLETPVQFIKGVGPKLGEVFSRRGISTVKDLLFFFPRSYEDRTQFSTASEMLLKPDGEQATVSLTVLSSRVVPLRSRKRMLEAKCSDETGIVNLKWFHFFPALEKKVSTGRKIIATGKFKRFRKQLEMVHPEIHEGQAGIETKGAEIGRIVPIYSEIEGITTRVLRKVLWNAVEKYVRFFKDDLPHELLRKYNLPPLSQAIEEIHFPKKVTQELKQFRTPEHARLIYDEFFKFQYLMIRQKREKLKEKAFVFNLKDSKKAYEELKRNLPFELTQDQKRSVEEILQDLSYPSPMNRLIQGDVGSGKTAVAFLTSGVVLAEGKQATLMAPTEILAEQHYKNALRFFGSMLRMVLLTGKTPPKERDQIIARLKSGEPLLVIGTHALIEDPVEFKSLAYVLIDEQHRFGVEQRRKLRDKGKYQIGNEDHWPHHLLLSATPIPRTLALTAFGNLHLSSIHELPPGRSPIQTEVVLPSQEMDAFHQIRQEIRQGRQAYFIYPLVNESEAEGFTQIKSAVQEFDRLKSQIFPEFELGLLHGKQSSKEKSLIMEQFKQNKLQILVSTTVVEVGVDVPNATIMVVEHADRFGLSQLHQLRGRVGRGEHRSRCFLFVNQLSGESTEKRLRTMERTQNGFEIAEADLEIRGPGDFLGTQQSGALPFRIGDLVRDRVWVGRAQKDAIELFDRDPNLKDPAHRGLLRYLLTSGKMHFENWRTS